MYVIISESKSEHLSRQNHPIVNISCTISCIVTHENVCDIQNEIQLTKGAKIDCFTLMLDWLLTFQHIRLLCVGTFSDHDNNEFDNNR